MDQMNTHNTHSYPWYRKDIDTTTCVVHVHFKETTKETLGDKIKRMLREDAEKQ